MQHDACGVGFIADTRRRFTHTLIDHGLTALRRLTHRGAPALEIPATVAVNE